MVYVLLGAAVLCLCWIDMFVIVSFVESFQNVYQKGSSAIKDL